MLSSYTCVIAHPDEAVSERLIFEILLKLQELQDMLLMKWLGAKVCDMEQL